MPDEYIDYIFCKHFGWTPDELDRQDSYILDAFAEIMYYEQEAQQREYDRQRKSFKQF